MSLPQAKKDISDSPAAGAVTEPIDRQKLQTDIDRKLQLYGVFAAIATENHRTSGTPLFAPLPHPGALHQAHLCGFTAARLRREEH